MFKPEKKTVAECSISGRLRISSILDGEDGGLSYVGKKVTVGGWARTVRKQCSDTLLFISLNDGSTASNLQCVVEKNVKGFEDGLKATAGCSFKVSGVVVKSPAQGQAVELLLNTEDDQLKICGYCDPSKYPLAKKHHSKEFLREVAHLRPRSQFFSSVMRIRNSLAIAIHEYFQRNGFLYIHTPIITAADCEGAGELFQVTTVLPNSQGKISDIPSIKCEGGQGMVVDYKKDFFGKQSFLTVSGQLALENFACSMSDVYTFGPTFRAENSHTARHLAEFWMIEPEMAFADLEDNMKLGEELLKYTVEYVLLNNMPDLQYLDKNIEKGLIERLKVISNTKFARISYSEAIEMLKPHEKEFTVPISWGMDLGSEHEKYITDVLEKRPCIIYNYPKDIKSFYMKLNEDGTTVAAMDILVPKIGEVVGGSQREDDFERLEQAIKNKNMDPAPYWWYSELRKYGTVPHSGFGLGFERLIMMVTGVENVRDVIPFPRYPDHCEF
ncbi:Asparaginyl-tRNA synthetase (NOB+tRNA synthase) [Cryptosporidium felis]|nr:Asparaginyl-tRNA synthetase (NOB+tRNA synthase) [Cryptosporidium felis]